MRSALVSILVCVAAAMPRLAAPQPAAWDEVAAAYAAVHDYTTRYEKEERAIDHGEIQWIRLSFRKPLDVRMEWLDRSDKVDQVAVYRQGMNDGKLIAHRNGVLGSMVGTVHLDPRDKRAMDDSRHPITEVGIGFIVEGIAQGLRNGRLVSAGASPDTLDSRPAIRYRFDAAPGSTVLGVPDAASAVVTVDGALKLPLKIELLDASGAMVERHRFKDLKINVGLTDAVFTL